jgi:hypothetical protein
VRGRAPPLPQRAALLAWPLCGPAGAAGAQAAGAAARAQAAGAQAGAAAAGAQAGAAAAGAQAAFA